MKEKKRRLCQNRRSLFFVISRNNDRLFFLLNPSEDVAENDPVRIVDAIVESLDLKEFKKLYRERGRCPYHPKMTLKVILYAYMNNIYSCRKI